MKPNTKRYTSRQSNPFIQSRIDYWLITSDIFYGVNECDIKSAIKTDHSLISLYFNNPKEEKRGPGLWKFNKHLLCDESFVGGLINLIKNTMIKMMICQIII